ncbi:hypothetical protein EYF80_048696 [Liparis tanakae]|uniref:Uncharacterized protein n=1 Tax=Liparis tanakae TaxID=230148 RepID=A0A4Z2FK24_9TELE|nr:hypothetical protein EYF80_048696 [Liparis tanakae]
MSASWDVGSMCVGVRRQPSEGGLRVEERSLSSPQWMTGSQGSRRGFRDGSAQDGTSFGEKWSPHFSSRGVSDHVGREGTAGDRRVGGGVSCKILVV